MAITRIKFNTTASDSGAFSLILNPSELELNDSDQYELVEILDGGQVKQEAFFDSRNITLTWKGIPTDFTGFQTMASTLKSYRNSIRFVNFGTADYRINATPQWVKTRVIDLDVIALRGGKVRYDMTLILSPEL